MRIPVRNLYYLLLYAWDCLPSRGVQKVGIDESPDLPNLLSNALNQGAHQLLRRGLDRGYVEVTEETRKPRGKLRLAIMAKQQTLLRGLAVCDLDELTVDVLHNKILRTTLLALANCDDVEEENRQVLHQAWLRMGGVSNIRLHADLFQRVQLSRNIAHYGFLMRVCELIFHMLLPDEQGGESRFRDLLKDEKRMWAVFEKFLRNFYRRELKDFTAQSKKVDWVAEAREKDHLKYLPEMRTDITLHSQDRVVVADAKYYLKALGGGRKKGNPKIRSGHLYQLLSYLTHTQRLNPDKQASGILVYPAVNYSLRLEYRLLDFPVTVATVNLGANWPTIHNELLDLVHVN